MSNQTNSKQSFYKTKTSVISDNLPEFKMNLDEYDIMKSDISGIPDASVNILHIDYIETKVSDTLFDLKLEISRVKKVYAIVENILQLNDKKIIATNVRATIIRWTTLSNALETEIKKISTNKCILEDVETIKSFASTMTIINKGNMANDDKYKLYNMLDDSIQTRIVNILGLLQE